MLECPGEEPFDVLRFFFAELQSDELQRSVTASERVQLVARVLGPSNVAQQLLPRLQRYCYPHPERDPQSHLAIVENAIDQLLWREEALGNIASSLDASFLDLLPEDRAQRNAALNTQVSILCCLACFEETSVRVAAVDALTSLISVDEVCENTLEQFILPRVLRLSASNFFSPGRLDEDAPSTASALKSPSTSGKTSGGAEADSSKGGTPGRPRGKSTRSKQSKSSGNGDAAAFFGARISSAPLLAACYPRLPRHCTSDRDWRTETRNAIGRLCSDEMPMVRFAALQALRILVPWYEQDTLQSDVVEVLSSLKLESQDEIRQSAVDIVAALLPRLTPAAARQVVLKVVDPLADDESWRVRRHLAECIDRLLRGVISAGMSLDRRAQLNRRLRSESTQCKPSSSVILPLHEDESDDCVCSRTDVDADDADRRLRRIGGIIEPRGVPVSAASHGPQQRWVSLAREPADCDPHVRSAIDLLMRNYVRLLDDMRESRVRRAALRQLRGVARAVRFQTLSRYLCDQPSEGGMEGDARVLRHLTTDEVDDVRVALAQTLTSVRTTMALKSRGVRVLALPVLLALLRDPLHLVRLQVMRRFGTVLDALLPVQSPGTGSTMRDDNDGDSSVSVADDEDDENDDEATRAALGEVVASVSQLLSDDKWPVRRAVLAQCVALARRLDFDTFAQRLLRDVVAAAADPVDEVRSEAAQQIALLSSPRDGFGPHWLRAFVLGRFFDRTGASAKGTDYHVRMVPCRLSDAFAQHWPRTPETGAFLVEHCLPSLLALCDDVVPNVRSVAARSLGRLAPLADREVVETRLIPCLRKVLQSGGKSTSGKSSASSSKQQQQQQQQQRDHELVDVVSRALAECQQQCQ
ncbi:MAG: hypothetical protein MHM6MM_003565 [Cercozoa sp. M6MM]